MIVKYISYSIILLLAPFFVNAQTDDVAGDDEKCDKVFLKGSVQDTVNPRNFYNLMVVNMSTKQGVFGDAKGGFSLYAGLGDTVTFSATGYDKKTITVIAAKNCQLDTTIYIDSKVQEYETVEVYPIKSLESIRKEREELSKSETRTVTGLNVMQSPITALYERFSKKAQSKRLVAEMEHQDNINDILKELLRVYVSYDVVYLEEEEFQSFVYFLNIDENFLKSASDYDLITYIKEKLEQYKSMNRELFQE